MDDDVTGGGPADDEPGAEAERLADQTLLGVMHDLLSDQALEFMRLVDSGEIDFDPGRPGGGVPAILSGLHGRRRSRALYLSEHPPQEDPSLFGSAPEDAPNSALRAMLWVALHAPQHPVRLNPSRTGMLRATYALPGAVTVSHLLLYDAIVDRDDLVVTAESLVAACVAYRWSPGNAEIGEGLALDESLLVEVDGPSASAVPEPVPWPETAATHRVLEIPLEVANGAHLLIPQPEPDEAAMPVPGVTRGGQARTTAVPASTLAAIGWLDPFCPSEEVDPGEGLFLGIGNRELYWWGNKTSLRTPKAPGNG